MDVITILQTLCILLVIIEYSAQIYKILQRKTVEDISFTYWFVKLTITILQIVILFLSVTPIKAYLSQVMSMVFCIVVFTLMNYYHNKNK